MRADRTHMDRLTPFHDKALKFDGAEVLARRIVVFVAGIKGPRQNPVTEREILRWFRSTDPEFVRKILAEVADEGRIQVITVSSSAAKKYKSL